jgi:hypothetical protein
VVVSHAAPLVSVLGDETDCRQIVLVKDFGETSIRDHALPSWQWPSR